MTRRPTTIVSRNQKGFGALSAVLGLAVVATVSVGLQQGLQMRAKSEKLKRDRILMDLGLDGNMARLEALVTDDSSYCGQGFGGCPGVFPDPVNCHPTPGANPTFVQMTPGTDWGFQPSTVLTTHFKVNEGAYTSPLNSKPLPRRAGGLGEFWFNVKKLGMLSEQSAANLMSQSYQSNPAGFSVGKVLTAIDGYECSSQGFVSGIFLHSKIDQGDCKDASLCKSTVPREINLHVPIIFSPPTCAVSLSKYDDVLEGEEVDIKLTASGVWDTAGTSVGGAFPNPSPTRSIKSTDLVWEGKSGPLIVPTGKATCNPYFYFDGWVKGPVSPQSSCSGLPVRVKVSQARFDAECKPLIIEHPTWYPSYDAKNPRIDDPPKPPIKQCPAPFHINSKGTDYMMVYIIRDGECLAVKARDW